MNTFRLFKIGDFRIDSNAIDFKLVQNNILKRNCQCKSSSNDDSSLIFFTLGFVVGTMISNACLLYRTRPYIKALNYSEPADFCD